MTQRDRDEQSSYANFRLLFIIGFPWLTTCIPPQHGGNRALDERANCIAYQKNVLAPELNGVGSNDIFSFTIQTLLFWVMVSLTE